MIKKLTDKKLRDGYSHMAADRAREREAQQWSESILHI